jgi:hypothetical protein
MLDNLVKKLDLFKSTKSNKRDENRNKVKYSIKEESKERYDRLIKMSPYWVEIRLKEEKEMERKRKEEEKESNKV